MLRFKFNSFKVLKSAEIDLADITVIAGNNATGKSTIARTISDFVFVAENYGVGVQRQLLRTNVLNKVLAFQNFFRKLMQERVSYGEKFKYSGKWLRMPRWHITDSFLSRGDFKAYLSSLERDIDDAIDEISETSGEYGRFMKQLLKELGIQGNDDLAQDGIASKAALKQCVGDMTAELTKAYDDACSTRDVRWLDSEMLGQLSYGVDGSAIQINEDGERIFPINSGNGVSIGVCASLSNAIYLRSPYHSNIQKKYGGWNIGGRFFPAEHESDGNSTEWLDRSFDFLGGDVFWDDKNGKWMFREASKEFDLSECATGIRALADFKILEQLHLLGPDTILILDEPEAHLHPEWVVKYAEILVQAVKTYGIHLLVATHSPMMMLALHDIAMEEGLKGRYKCYQTEPVSENPRQTIVKAVDDDIAPSFDSFNKAYDLVDNYRSKGGK